MTPKQERAEQEIDDRLLEAQLALKDCMDELEQVKSEREDWKFGSNANAREMQRLKEVSDMKDAIIEGMRNVVAHARMVRGKHLGLDNALEAYDKCKLPAMGPSGMNPKNVDQFKTREMVRELVGALEFYGNRESWHSIDDLYFYHRRDIIHKSDTDLTRPFSSGLRARGILAKYATEIAQLGRDQNGASST